MKLQRDDPLWSANIKKGLISLFQVNLDQKYSVDPVPSKGIEFDPMRPAYTVWEVIFF
jgi:hypothetical protein